MFSRLQKLMFTLALVAVGTAQLFGVHGGYLCPCSGQTSPLADCAAACHAEAEPHACEAFRGGAPSDQESDQESDQDSDHDHRALRQSLVAAPSPPPPSPPAVVLFDLPPALQLPELHLQVALVAPPRPERCPGQAPPSALLVAQTMVRMI